MTQPTPFPVKAAVMESELLRWFIRRRHVLDGAPESSGLVLWKSPDGTHCHGIWRCTPSRFTWRHVDETGYVVEGRVTVTLEGGEPLHLGAGDVVFFPGGPQDRVARPRDTPYGLSPAREGWAPVLIRGVGTFAAHP